MASWNPADYETVAERIKRFYLDHPDGRIITKNVTRKEDRAVLTWVVKAEIWLPFEQSIDGPHFSKQPGAYLKATGYAFEIDGQGMANKTSALENAETSSIGRALANAGYSGDRRATREEMAKVDRNQTPKAPKNWLKLAEDLAWKKDLDGLISLYNEMVQTKAPQDLVDKVKQIGNDLRGSSNPAS